MSRDLFCYLSLKRYVTVDHSGQNHISDNKTNIDIWRIRNPDVKRFSWRQKNPAIQRRLDYWLITDSLQEEVEKVDIIPAIIPCQWYRKHDLRTFVLEI